MANETNSQGLIAVDKMGAKVLFLNPKTYETEVVLDGFKRTVHELLVVPATGSQPAMAYVPIFGDGIHGRNPNPQHELCVFDLQQTRPGRDHRPLSLYRPAHAQARAGRIHLYYLREFGRGGGDRPQGQ